MGTVGTRTSTALPAAWPLLASSLACLATSALLFGIGRAIGRAADSDVCHFANVTDQD